MEGLLSGKPEIKLVKVDIDSWTSPVARQYNIRQIPLLLLFEDQEMTTVGTQEVLSRIQ